MTSVTLIEQRCLRHPAREAVARCPHCHYSFCRECITEHDDRVLCADCLAKLSRASEKRSSFVAQILTTIFGIGGIMTAWLFFYFIGQMLARAPVSFHEGTVWKKLIPEE